MIKKGAEIKNSEEELSKAELEKMLIDNFVNLQRVLTNLSIKFDSLSDKISKLLQLFEISAKSFIEKQSPEIEGEEKDREKNEEKDKEFLNKLDILFEQNKTIARSLTLMEEKLREKIYGPNFETEERERPSYPRF